MRLQISSMARINGIVGIEIPKMEGEPKGRSQRRDRRPQRLGRRGRTECDSLAMAELVAARQTASTGKRP
jgi:hypothetical protein